MLKVTKFYCRSFDIDSLTIFWEIEDVSLTDDIYAYEFSLLKCESPAGPYDLVYGPFKNIFLFRDSVHPENHKNRTIFYKLQIKDSRSGQITEWGPTAQLPEPNLEALEMIRLEDVLFRNFIGRKFYLLPRKTFGARCICFNKIMQRQEIANCKTCFGVGYVGGWNTPISFYAQKDPKAKQLQLTPTINHTPSLITMRTISYPPINPGDLVVDSENHRSIVISSTPTQRLGADIHQEVVIKELLKGSIEYLVPIKDDIKKIDQISDRRLFENPMTLNSDPRPNYLGDSPDGIVY